MRRRRG